ncbi:hypothetical protein [Metallosphaera tengchongensis]|uniref:hypothetical protein n=1 Tax=Metallosphaera tengchongensis TaxID=1532350 RepID=UPI0031B5FE44
MIILKFSIEVMGDVRIVMIQKTVLFTFGRLDPIIRSTSRLSHTLASLISASESIQFFLTLKLYVTVTFFVSIY